MNTRCGPFSQESESTAVRADSSKLYQQQAITHQGSNAGTLLKHSGNVIRIIDGYGKYFGPPQPFISIQSRSIQWQR